MHAPSWGPALTSLSKWTIPDFYDKVPYDSSNVWILVSPMPFVFLQIHLLLRYDPKTTLLLRASLIPIIVILSLRSAFAFYYKVTGEGQLDGRGQHLNITVGCGAFSNIAWSLGWGLTLQRPRFKVRPSQSNGSDKSSERDVATTKKATLTSMPLCFPGTFVPLELDLLINIRGVGWEHGIKNGAPALPVPTFTSRQRWAWIRERLKPVPFYFLLYDAIFVLIEDRRFNVHSVGATGGSIWECRQGSFGVAGPYLICFAYASSFVCVQHLLHTVFGCLAVGFFGDIPSRWDPPAVDVPWISSSVGEFWGRRWHQYLRITFMTVGYWPVRSFLTPIAGRRVANIAAIFGAFMASGLVHDLGRVTLAPKPGFAITEVSLFFAIQPLAIFAEQVWHYYTGHRVQGVLGWIWTMIWLLITSPLLFEVRSNIRILEIDLESELLLTSVLPCAFYSPKQTMNRDGMLASENMTLALTQRPVTLMLDWWDRKFNTV